MLASPCRQDEFISQDEEDEECDIEKDKGEVAQPGWNEHEAINLAAQAYLRAGRFDKAINAFNEALQNADVSEDRVTLFLGRAEAYAGLSRHLSAIPAVESERRAVFAPDPHRLASCALRDAEEALKLQSCRVSAAHLVKGDALFLLERYGEAHCAFRQALSYSRNCRTISARLKKCDQALAGGIHCPMELPEEPSQHGRELAIERALALVDAECTLCLKLLYEPVTTPCGHTFCRCCLVRCLDHTGKCPMCRTVLHLGQQLPVSVVLKNLLEHAFPQEYDARREEEINLMSCSETQRALLPLFVMSAMLPGERMALNVFEPRYRLMVRRVMEGGRKFGMATINGAHQLNDVACEVEVVECEALPDGRFYLEVLGRRRFKPLNPCEQDGYRLAQVEYISDSVPPSESMEETELQEVWKEVEDMADTWVRRVRALGQSRRAAADLLRRVGEKPSAGNVEQLSFWVVGYLY